MYWQKQVWGWRMVLSQLHLRESGRKRWCIHIGNIQKQSHGLHKCLRSILVAHHPTSQCQDCALGYWKHATLLDCEGSWFPESDEDRMSRSLYTISHCGRRRRFAWGSFLGCPIPVGVSRDERGEGGKEKGKWISSKSNKIWHYTSVCSGILVPTCWGIKLDVTSLENLLQRKENKIMRWWKNGESTNIKYVLKYKRKTRTCQCENGSR